MYLSPLGVLKEASNRMGFGVTAAAKARVRVLCKERASGVEIDLPSYHPNCRRRIFGGGRFTVDAQKKEKPDIMMP
jgi:hypothetical protein